MAPENGNLPARANPARVRKMKSRQISLALFIKFDNRYRPPERQKHSAVWRLEEGEGAEQRAVKDSFPIIQSLWRFRHQLAHSYLYVCTAALPPLSHHKQVIKSLDIWLPSRFTSKYFLPPLWRVLPIRNMRLELLWLQQRQIFYCGDSICESNSGSIGKGEKNWLDVTKQNISSRTCFNTRDSP